MRLREFFACSMALGAVVACSPGPRDPADYRRTAARVRPFEARLAGPFPHRSCRDREPAELDRARATSIEIHGKRCPPLATSFLRELQELRPGFPSGPRFTSREWAFWVLLTQPGPEQLDRAIAELEAALREHPRDTQVVIDLSAALLERARRNGDPLDLLSALEISLLATAVAPLSAEAWFNRGLALEDAQLEEEAEAAWARAVELESEPGWKSEAVRHRTRLAKRLAKRARDPRGDFATWMETNLPDDGKEGVPPLPRKALRHWAAHAPEQVRLWMENVGFSSWAEAELSGIRSASDAWLDLLRDLAELSESSSGDGLLSASVERIRGASLTGRRRLAMGHRAYGRGLQSLGSQPRTRARDEFRESGRILADEGSPFAVWASLQVSLLDWYDHRYDAVSEALEQLRASVDSSLSLLLARTYWIDALAHQGAGRPVAMRDAAYRARELFLAAGELGHGAAMEVLLADADRLLGRGGGRRAWMHRFRALAGAGHMPSDRRRLGMFQELALGAREVEKPRAAALFSQASQRVAERAGEPLFAILALEEQAEILALSGQRQESREVLEQAFRLVDRLEDVEVRVSTEADLWATMASTVAEGREEKIRAWSRAIELFLHTGYEARLVEAWGRRAELWRREGRIESALADLEAAEELLDGHHARTLRRGRWQAGDGPYDYVHRNRQVFETRALTELALGRPSNALLALDRGKARDLSTLRHREGSRDTTSLEVDVPGRMVLHLGSLNGEIRLWTVRGSEVDTTLSHLSTGLLGIHLESLEKNPDRQVLAELFDALILPIHPQLDSAEQLVIVPDGDLFAVPFAALFDRRAGRFLIEELELVVAPSWQAFRNAERRRAALPAPESMAIVANPAWDLRHYGEYLRLPAAEKLLPHLARISPSLTRLVGEAATDRAVLQALGTHDWVHLASHLVIHDDAPLLSFLLTAAGARSEIYAHQLLDLDLDRTQLVGLAACRGIGDRHPRGLGGFVRPLLGRGVPTVVGSLWLVQDRATSELFARFYSHLDQDPRRPAAALRRAQLDLLLGSDEELRAPGIWGAFAVFGAG